MVSIPNKFQQQVDLPNGLLSKAFAAESKANQPGKAGQGHAYGHARQNAKAIANNTGSSSNQAIIALDSLSSLISAQAEGDEGGAWSLESGESETYELYGHPDPFQALLAILDRPVGMGVVRKSKTVSVVQADGTVTTEVQSDAQYVQRQYTGEELVYLDQQDRSKGKRRARVGEMDYTLKKK